MKPLEYQHTLIDTDEIVKGLNTKEAARTLGAMMDRWSKDGWEYCGSIQKHAVFRKPIVPTSAEEPA